MTMLGLYEAAEILNVSSSASATPPQKKEPQSGKNKENIFILCRLNKLYF
jgi:hypothetical protein